jgi:hypothetical protein
MARGKNGAESQELPLATTATAQERSLQAAEVRELRRAMNFADAAA